MLKIVFHFLGPYMGRLCRFQHRISLSLQWWKLPRRNIPLSILLDPSIERHLNDSSSLMQTHSETPFYSLLHYLVHCQWTSLASVEVLPASAISTDSPVWPCLRTIYITITELDSESCTDMSWMQNKNGWTAPFPLPCIPHSVFSHLVWRGRQTHLLLSVWTHRRH